MSKLTKDFTINIIPGTAGTPGSPGAPGTPAYFTQETVWVNNVPNVPGPTAASYAVAGETDSQGRVIRLATYTELCDFIPSLGHIRTLQIQGKDPGDAKHIAKVKELIWKEVNRPDHTLGRVLGIHPSYRSGDTNRAPYIAVWILAGGLGLCYFSGYYLGSRPTMVVVDSSVI